MGVLEVHLARQKEVHPGGDGPWLIGNKFSVADLAFISGQHIIATVLSRDEFEPIQFELVQLSARPAIAQVMEDAFKKHGGK